MSIVSHVVESIVAPVGKIFYANVLFFTETLNLPFIIFITLLACIYFSFKLRFVNFRHFGDSFKIFFAKEKTDDAGKTITSRSAFLAAISGCVGVGSISGVAAAVYYGGPGVIFWLIVGAFVVMPLRFVEVYLGHYFRSKDKEGNIVVYGPFAYIKNGLSELGIPKIGKLFAAIFAISLFFTSIAAIMLQSGPTAELISGAFFEKSQTYALVVTVALAVITLFIVFGGLSRISKAIEKMALVMSVIYILSILLILGLNIKAIPGAVSLIVSSAFQAKSIYGGMFGVAIVALIRIISMNEIGLGTVSILHSKSKNENSAKEAILAMIGPFVAILIFVVLNSFAVIVTGSHNSGHNGVMMIHHMFSNVSSILSFALVIVMILFSITTLIAWYFYAETSLKELKGGNIFIKIYPLFFILIIVCSAVLPFQTILQLVDVFGIAIIVPNIIIFFLLGGKVSKGLRNYEQKQALEKKE